MRKVGGWCEIAASVGIVRHSPAVKDLNTEAEEAALLEAVTRRQPAKIQQTEKA
jgi:hypothetical protein